MADKKTQLEATLDASGVESGANKAKQALNSLGDTAVAVGEKGSKGVDKIAASGDQAARKLSQTNQNLISLVQRNIAAIEAGVEATGRMSSRYVESLARQRGASVDVLRPYLQQLDEAIAKQRTLSQGQRALTNPLQGVSTSLGATPFQKPLPANLTTSLGATAFGEVAAGATKAKDAVNEFEKRFGSAGRTAKQTQQALQQIPAQFTDIVVSLQGGQNPLTVLLQQGGQLRDVFGGIGPAARALGSYIVGLVNPYTAAAGAVAALGVAYFRTTEQQDAFARSLILSGNAAGTTVSQLSAMASSIASSTVSYGKAAEALTQFAADGNVAAGKLEDVARAAVRLQQVGGPAVDKLVQQFADLAKDPLQASIKLNESTRFLTTSIYQQIKALEDSGQTAKAAAEAQAAYLNAIEDRGKRLEDRLGNIERIWLRIKALAAGGLDTLGSVVAPTDDDRNRQAIENLRALEELDRKVREGGGVPTQQFQQRLQEQRQVVDAIRETQRLQQKSVQLQDEENAKVKARIAFDKQGIQFQSESLKIAKEIVEARNLGVAAGATPQEIAARIADIQAKFAKKPKDTSAAARALDRSELAFDLSQIKAESDKLVGIYADAERTLETLRAAGLVDESDYYQAKRGFLERTTAAQEDAFQREIERLRQEDLKGKDKIDNDRKIAEAEAKLAILRASSSSKANNLLIEEEAAARRLASAYLAARQAAEEYFANQVRQQQRSLSAIGEGPREQARNVGIAAIEDDFARQRQALEFQRARLEAEGKFTTEAQKQYENQLAIIREFQAKSIASFEAYYQRILELQGDASVGASRAVKTYIDEAANVAQSTDQFISNSLQGAEDALTAFITTGKANFKDFANAIVADITRIIIKQQIANALAGQLGSGGGDSGFVGQLFSALMGSNSASRMSSGAFGIGLQGFANGGYVERGRMVEVNEAGAPGELFTVGGRQYLLASQGGYVTPQKSSGSGAAAMTINQQFVVSAPPDRRTQSEIAAAAGRGVQVAIARNR